MFSQFQTARLASLLVLIFVASSGLAQGENGNGYVFGEETVSKHQEDASIDLINYIGRMLESELNKTEPALDELEVAQSTNLYRSMDKYANPTDTKEGIPEETVEIKSRIEESEGVLTNKETGAAHSTGETSPVERVGDCIPIGMKCYRHEECCSMRCHGFLHQCVT